MGLGSRSRRLAAAAAALALSLGVAGAVALATRAPSFLGVTEPLEGQVVGLAGVEVLVRFPPGRRVAAPTFRLLLNGSDVTHEVTTGENGAYGRLYALLDGENVLRFGVFGRRWWPASELVEQVRDVRVLSRRPTDLDRG